MSKMRPELWSTDVEIIRLNFWLFLWSKKMTSHNNGFKTKVALEEMLGNMTVAEIATHYNVARV